MHLWNNVWFSLPVPEPINVFQGLASTQMWAKLFYGHALALASYLVMAVLITNFILRRSYLKHHKRWYWMTYAIFVFTGGVVHFLWIYMVFVRPRIDLYSTLVLLLGVVSAVTACFTPAALKYVSELMHDARGRETELLFKIEVLSDRLKESDERGTAERGEIINLLRTTIEQGQSTMAKVDEAAQSARAAAEKILTKNKQNQTSG